MGRRIFIAGYYGHGNLGDEAILHAIRQTIWRRDPRVELVVASNDPAETERQHGLEACPAMDIEACSRACRESDAVVLGGGGLLHDYWPARLSEVLTPAASGLVIYLGFPHLAALWDRPLCMYSIGVGPFQNEAGRRQAGLALGMADSVTVRDEWSRTTAEGLGVDPARLQVTADPVFALEGNEGSRSRADEMLEQALGGPEGPWLGVQVRWWGFGVDADRWPARVAGGIRTFLDRNPEWRVLFLPFQEGPGTQENDRNWCERVRTELGSEARTAVLAPTSSPETMLAILSRSAAVLSMRYHAGLLAMMAGARVVGLAYDPKVRSLFEAAGESSLVLSRSEWSAPKIATALEAVSGQPEPNRTSFLHRMRMGATVAADLCLEVADGNSAAAGTTLLRKYDAVRHLARRRVLSPASVEDGASGSVEAEKERIVDLELEVATERARRKRAEEALSQSRVQLERRELEVRWLQDARIQLLADLQALSASLGELRCSRLVRQAIRVRALVRRLRNRARVAHRFSDWLRGSDVFRARQEPPPGRPVSGATQKSLTGYLDEFLPTAMARRERPLVMLLSGTAMRQDEGQRPTQLASALARSGHAVVFCYWRWDKTETTEEEHGVDGVLQVPLDLVTDQPDVIARRFAQIDAERVALVEFPHPSLFTLLAHLNAQGWYTIYDVLDDWAEFQRVGQADWYSQPVECHVARAVDGVIAVHATLARRVMDIAGLEEPPNVVPNGYHPEIAEVRNERKLERGTCTIGYFGYLSEAWFDWNLLAVVARERPDWRIYIIGYGGRSPVKLPDNVALLGKQPQRDLAAYASNWDAAMIPFKHGTLSSSADPIKLYEYLAMGLPVVVTGVEPPGGMRQWVRSADDPAEFVAEIEDVTSLDARQEQVDRQRLVTDCTWGHRVEDVLDVVKRDTQRVREKSFLVRGAV